MNILLNCMSIQYTTTNRLLRMLPITTEVRSHNCAAKQDYGIKIEYE